MSIPLGLCQCGCGERTAARNGEFNAYVRHHHLAAAQKGGVESPSWKGGRNVVGGYVYLHMPDHPNADGRGYVSEHVLVASKVLGGRVPNGVHVHHVNRDRSDNRPENLVICEDAAYHQLIHRRMAAIEACGNPDWRKCKFCKSWDSPENLQIEPQHKRQFHVECRNEYARNQYTRKRSVMAP